MLIIVDNGEAIPVESRLTSKLHEGDFYYAVKVTGGIELVFQNRMIMQDINPLGEMPTVQLRSKNSAPGSIDKDENIHLPQDFIEYAHLEEGAVIEGNRDKAIIFGKPA